MPSIDSKFHSDHLHTSFGEAVGQNFDIGSELGDMPRDFWSLKIEIPKVAKPAKPIEILYVGLVWDFNGFQGISLKFR